MDSEVLGILGLVLIFIVREMPLAGDVIITRPRLPTIRMWSRAAEASQAWAGRHAAAIPIQPAKANPFRPHIPREALCFERLDLAAVGK